MELTMRDKEVAIILDEREELGRLKARIDSASKYIAGTHLIDADVLLDILGKPCTLPKDRKEDRQDIPKVTDMEIEGTCQAISYV